jgi:hypothetical protein
MAGREAGDGGVRRREKGDGRREAGGGRQRPEVRGHFQPPTRAQRGACGGGGAALDKLAAQVETVGFYDSDYAGEK